MYAYGDKCVYVCMPICVCVCVCVLWGLYQVSRDPGRKWGGRCYEQIIDTERKK